VKNSPGLLLGLLFLACSLPFAAQAQEAQPEISGSIKTHLYLVGEAPLGGVSGGWILDSPLRLRLFYKPGDVFSLETAGEVSNRFQSGSSASSAGFFLPPPSSYRLADFSNPLAGPASGNGDQLLANLDRLSASFHFGGADLTLGRQVVSFGSARVVNPTDVLAPFNIQTRDQENRSGVDAVRFQYDWGAFGGLDAGWVLGKNASWADSAVFLRPHFQAAGWNFSILGMDFRENLLAGLDLQGSLAGAGVWAEGAWVQTKTPDASYARLSAGSDYNFTGDVYGTLEYHFNGAGQFDASNYFTLSHPEAYRAGTVYLLGRHYLVPSLSFQVTSLLSAQAEVLTNLTDGSFLGVLNTEYNAAENWYLNLGGMQPVGGKPSGVTPSSEFGFYPAFLYASVRFYF
jgi:hypothetical protein